MASQILPHPSIRNPHTTPEIQMTRKCCECDYCGGYDEGLNLVILFKKLVLKSTLCLLQELDPGGWERS